MATPHTAYDIVINAETFAALAAYKQDLQNGAATAGARLRAAFDKSLAEMSVEDFLQALLSTKVPRIFAESEIMGGGADWNARELALLGDIGVFMPVRIFDNGAWSTNDPAFREYAQPIEGCLLFTPGALLAEPPLFSGALPDRDEVTAADGTIDPRRYQALVERRLLPLLAVANDAAGKEGVPAFITVPGIGCGQFAGPYRGKMGAYLKDALIALLEKHASALPHISGVYFDPFAECANETRTIGNIRFFVRPSSQNAAGAQLSEPAALAGHDFKGHKLYKIVAWDHVSLPGNDFYTNIRATDDGAAAAATDAMTRMTGIGGTYKTGAYLNKAGYKDWESAAVQTKTRLTVSGNLKVVSGSGVIALHAAPKAPAAGKPPKPPTR